MILGLGIDLFPIARLERELSRWGTDFLEEFSSRTELRHAREIPWSTPRLAAGFAGKEAIFKMLGTGRTPQMRWGEIEILPRTADLGTIPGANLFAVYGQVTSTPTGSAPTASTAIRPGPAPADSPSTEPAPIQANAEIRLHGAVLEAARSAGIRRITLELEYSGSHVLAIAIAESGLRPGDAPPSSAPRSTKRAEPLVKGGLS